MSTAAPTYDLTLLLDPQAEESVRAKIVADARASIEAQGELVRYDRWGERQLSYPIDRKASAEYHLLQFHATDSELLHGLDRTLRITDGILRFRIIKLRPGVPAPPEMAAPARREEEAPAPAEDAPPAPEPAAAEPAEPAAPTPAP